MGNTFFLQKSKPALLLQNIYAQQILFFFFVPWVLRGPTVSLLQFYPTKGLYFAERSHIIWDNVLLSLEPNSTPQHGRRGIEREWLGTALWVQACAGDQVPCLNLDKLNKSRQQKNDEKTNLFLISVWRSINDY